MNKGILAIKVDENGVHSNVALDGVTNLQLMEILSELTLISQDITNLIRQQRLHHEGKTF